MTIISRRQDSSYLLAAKVEDIFSSKAIKKTNSFFSGKA